MFGLTKRLNEGDSRLRCTAIIVAAGNSARMNGRGSKVFIDVFDKPVLAYTVEPFQQSDLVNDIIIVTKEEDIIYCGDAVVHAFGYTKVSRIVAGGNERQHSVFNGLNEAQNSEIVVVHDGARPLVTIEEIENCINECIEHRAITVGVRVKDTIKEVNHRGFIQDTPDRTKLWAVQTPQVFDYNLLVKAHQEALKEKFVTTDDAALIERMGVRVKVVEGSYRNIKITTPEDLEVFEALVGNRMYQSL